MPFVIVNPSSGGGRAGRAWARVGREWCHRRGWASVETRGPGEARPLARERAGDTDVIVAFGGDGTLSEVAAGVLDAGGTAAVGLVPCGTGNDFARTLGLPRTPAAGLETVASGRTRRLDVGEAHYTAGDGTEAAGWFVNSASFGLSGAVADEMSRIGRRLGGTIAFARATLRAARASRPIRVHLQFDPGEVTVDDELLQVTVTNGKYFGGGMKISPLADPADGWLDVVLVRPVGFGRLILELPKLYAGTHLRSPLVRFERARAVMARADGPPRFRLELDGEIVGWLPARLAVRPLAIGVRVPKEFGEPAG